MPVQHPQPWPRSSTDRHVGQSYVPSVKPQNTFQLVKYMFNLRDDRRNAFLQMETSPEQLSRASVLHHAMR